MKKSNEELIKALKKANKERRLKIAEKAGYKTAEEYLLSLYNVKPAKKAVAKAIKKKVDKIKPMIDYVVAFDTTGSMSSYIDDVKKHVRNLIPEMFSQDIDLKMKIIAFGDYCDMKGENNFGNAYQQSKFTDNQNELINFVIGAEDTGGGDSDEFYELVIKKITEETPWREGSKRVVLLIADCNPHAASYSWFNKRRGIDWIQEAKKAAKLNISFDTLSIHGKSYQWYKELSKITNGVYLPFQSSNKMSEVVTASLYVRGSAKSVATYTASYDAAVSSGDTELIGVYKSLNTLL